MFGEIITRISLYFCKKEKELFVSKREHTRIVRQLYEELKRKDLKIKKIKEENMLLLKAALKQSQRNEYTTQRDQVLKTPDK